MNVRVRLALGLAAFTDEKKFPSRFGSLAAPQLPWHGMHACGWGARGFAAAGKFGVIGKLLSGKEVQSSPAREKPGKALLTPLIPTQPPSRPPSKSFHPLRWSVATDAPSRVSLQGTFPNDAKRIPKVALPIYPAAVRVGASLEKSHSHPPNRPTPL